MEQKFKANLSYLVDLEQDNEKHFGTPIVRTIEWHTDEMTDAEIMEKIKQDTEKAIAVLKSDLHLIEKQINRML